MSANFHQAHHPLADIFPLTATGPDTRPELKTSAEIDEAIDKKVREMTASIRLAKVVPKDDAQAQKGKETDPGTTEDDEDETPRPGHAYKIYRDESDLPKAARKFYETAAGLAGLSLKTLVLSVYGIESKLERLQYDIRRAEEHDEDIWMEIN